MRIRRRWDRLAFTGDACKGHCKFLPVDCPPDVEYIRSDGMLWMPCFARGGACLNDTQTFVAAAFEWGLLPWQWLREKLNLCVCMEPVSRSSLIVGM